MSVMQYAYTGDIKRLKPAGWTFQKLFGANYKSYHMDDIFMFVVSHMVLEISNVEAKFQPALIEFILDHADEPDDFWIIVKPMGGKFAPMIVDRWYLTNHGRVVDYRENNALFVEANKELWDMGQPDLADRREAKIVAQEKEGGRDSFTIRPELVKKIIALNNLHPLELVNSWQ